MHLTKAQAFHVKIHLVASQQLPECQITNKKTPVMYTIYNIPFARAQLLFFIFSFVLKSFQSKQSKTSERKLFLVIFYFKMVNQSHTYEDSD